MYQLPRSIVLVGIMGAGKSTVGRLVAARLGCRFSDIDPEMERRDGRPVREIWEQDGDAVFAALERAALLDFLAQPPHVIALGGGTFVRPEIRALLRSSVTTVWLRATSATIISRIEAGEDRHPETRRNAAVEMAGLAERRERLYGEADVKIENDAITPGGAVQRIVTALQLS